MSLPVLSDEWKKLIAYTPQEKREKMVQDVHLLTSERIWEKEVGQGGIFAEYLDHDLTLLPYITTGKTEETSRSGRMKNITLPVRMRALRIYLRIKGHAYQAGNTPGIPGTGVQIQPASCNGLRPDMSEPLHAELHKRTD